MLVNLLTNKPLLGNTMADQEQIYLYEEVCINVPQDIPDSIVMIKRTNVKLHVFVLASPINYHFLLMSQ